jgi:hypothetical protein
VWVLLIIGVNWLQCRPLTKAFDPCYSDLSNSLLTQVIIVTKFATKVWRILPLLSKLGIVRRKHTINISDLRFSRRRVQRCLSSGLLRRVVWYRLPISLMMEVASISETSVNFCQTTRLNNPSSYSPPWEPEISLSSQVSCPNSTFFYTVRI